MVLVVLLELELLRAFLDLRSLRLVCFLEEWRPLLLFLRLDPTGFFLVLSRYLSKLLPLWPSCSKNRWTFVRSGAPPVLQSNAESDS